MFVKPQKSDLSLRSIAIEVSNAFEEEWDECSIIAVNVSETVLHASLEHVPGFVNDLVRTGNGMRC